MPTIKLTRCDPLNKQAASTKKKQCAILFMIIGIKFMLVFLFLWRQNIEQQLRHWMNMFDAKYGFIFFCDNRNSMQ